jgi:hypothetical protein
VGHYRDALVYAQTQLTLKLDELARLEDDIAALDREIVKLRRIISALAQLLGEPDGLGDYPKPAGKRRTTRVTSSVSRAQ